MRKVPNTIWTRAENSQNTSGSLTCEKSQTPSGNEPKTAKTECLTLRTDALKTKLMPHLPIAKTSFKTAVAGSETAEQQQESCPTCLPSTAPRISNVAYWRPKKQSLCHTYLLQKPVWESQVAGSENSQNTSGSLRCEKSQTTSGHEPKTAKTHAVALHAKSPKHHLETSRKQPKPSV